MKKVVVTGATGFIGKFLVRELVKRDVEVIAVCRKESRNLQYILDLPVRIVDCNILDLGTLPKLIPDRDIDTIFHLAWQGVSDMEAKDQSVQLQNLQSTLELIDAIYEMQISTFIGCGSIHEAEGLVEMGQDKIVNNLGFMYKASKMAAHWMGKSKCGAYGIRFFWPLINTYGEEEQSMRLINSMIRKIYKGESPRLSDGAQFYDFVHVSDVARALCLIAEKGVDGKNYVIGSGDAKPLREFLVTVGEVANRLNGGSAIPLGFGEIKSNVTFLPVETFDVTSLREDTGFQILVSFEEGIERTARWIIKNQKD